MVTSIFFTVAGLVAPPPPDIRFSEPRITIARVHNRLPQGYYPLDSSPLVPALKGCGFRKFRFGEYPTYYPIHVDPADNTAEKLQCLKAWAQSKPDLQIDWLK